MINKRRRWSNEYEESVELPVPGRIKLRIKQRIARARGMMGTARWNIPCRVLVECPPDVFTDGRLFDDIETWLRRDDCRWCAWIISLARERISSFFVEDGGGGDDDVVFICDSNVMLLSERKRKKNQSSKELIIPFFLLFLFSLVLVFFLLEL